MNKKIIIYYFPKGLRYTTPIIVASGIYLIIISHFIWGGLLVLLTAIMITTRYVTEINFEKKVYQDYLFFLGLSLNREVKRFNHIERIIVTKGNYSQMLNTRVQSRQMNWSDYTGTIIHDGTGKLDLLTSINKDELIRELIVYAQFLEVGIEDRTTSRPYWVDLNKAAKSLN